LLLIKIQTQTACTPLTAKHFISIYANAGWIKFIVPVKRGYALTHVIKLAIAERRMIIYTAREK
jgi:hypothetical protein